MVYAVCELRGRWHAHRNDLLGSGLASTLELVFKPLRRSPHILESSWHPRLEPEDSMFRLTHPQRVLIEPDLFSGRFAEREIDRVIVP